MASSRRRTALAIIFLIVVVTVCVVLLAVVLTTTASGRTKGKNDSGESSSTVSPSSMPTPKERFTFQNIFNFATRSFSINWISDSKYTLYNGGNITITDLSNNNTKVLVPASVIVNQNASSYYYWLSPDEQWVLLTCNSKKLYRNSYTADYVAYNVDKGDIVQITPPDKTKKIQLAIWGNKGNSLAYVQNNNIYYMSNVTSQPRQITSNGEEHKIFNGITDWVYEEDVYYSKQAMWFSPDDLYLGFIEFNDTEVDWFSYIRYGPYSHSYPEVIRIAYPKPGRPNPKVKVKVVDLSTQSVTPKVLDPPNEFIDMNPCGHVVHNKDASIIRTAFSNPSTEIFINFSLRKLDHYFTNMAWNDNSILLIAWSNRVQNVSIFMEYNLTSGKSYENQRQEVKNGWVDPSTYLKPNPWFSTDGSYYLIQRPFDQRSAGKFIHLAKISMGERGTITNLTSGQWEVRGILAFNKDKQIVYFSSTETSARESHIYSLDLKNNKKTCLSCAIPWAESGRCKYFTATFSKSVTWYKLQCYGPGVPLTSLHNTQTNKDVILESNEQVIERMKKMMVPQRRSFTFKSGGYTIDGMEILPPDFDPNKKYGVLLDVYGGPGSQRVTEDFGISNRGWNAYLVSNYDIILVRIDGRGQKSRGERFKHEVYLKLGEYEADDTINAGRYMQTKPYVDKDKLGIWGWSYGGYLTTYVLSKNSGVFKVGLAVAPVTDWRYYDTAYTERYMGLLEDNMDGYTFTSLLNRASQFRNVSYLIVHGSGDDNVHYQHTAQMVKALTLAQIDFRVQYYTDKAHSIAGSFTRRHLWHLLSEYLTTKLGLKKRI